MLPVIDDTDYLYLIVTGTELYDQAALGRNENFYMSVVQYGVRSVASSNKLWSVGIIIIIIRNC